MIRSSDMLALLMYIHVQYILYLSAHCYTITDVLYTLFVCPGTHLPPATTAANPAPTRAELTFRDSELMMIAQRIPQDWMNVGIKLGLMFTTLENIRVKHPFDCQQAAIEMFGVWRRTKGEEATRAALKEALMCVGYGRVADDIFSQD